MPRDLWKRNGGGENVRRLGGKAWRVVEGQHVISTRHLVDSAEEQEILERLLETGKPPLPAEPGIESLHYLLSTPFRYRPLRHGSRFASRNERSLWYGSARLRTAFAETSYYRLLFLEGTAADLGPLVLEFSAFRVPVRTGKGVDLCRPPFDALRERIAAPNRYDETQALGAAMREAGVEAFRYPSARDRGGGANVALFSPRAFGASVPETPEAWTGVADRNGVEFTKKDFFARRTLRFPREDFLVQGALPAPAP